MGQGAVGWARTEQVVDWLDDKGPATYHELAETFDWGLDYARFVMNALEREGLIRRVGKRKAKTRPQTLWDLA